MKLVSIENQDPRTLNTKTLTKHLQLFGARNPLILEVCYQLRRKEKITRNLILRQLQHKVKIFFSIWVSFHKHSRFKWHQGKGKAISLTPLDHLHPLLSCTPLKIFQKIFEAEKNIRTFPKWHNFQQKIICTGSCSTNFVLRRIKFRKIPQIPIKKKDKYVNNFYEKILGRVYIL